MTEMTLATVLTEMVETEGGYSAPVAENWAQGRTAYGGYTATLLLAATRRALPDHAPLRSAMINFTGPLSAAPQISVEVLRQGRNVTTALARAEIEGKVAATGTFSFGAAQDSHVSEICPAPDAPAPEDTPSFFPKEMKRLPARFFNNFEIKLIEGSLPFMGAEKGRMRVWCRHKDAASRGSLEGLFCLGDALPPAIFAKCKIPGPNSSVNWMFNLMLEDIATRDGWYMLESELTAAGSGYSSQVMRLWNTKGQLVADAMQSVVIFM
ncbi:acyl-CoA thioesterase II [Pseudophaeobacter sp. EL27]|uniref:acyl-CoA thioesterase n=1 Tax=Pseudophaeobacter sp. EL27 TaxID=2107580 RepID=UPI000EFC504A|nr:thioesterase family protein [Pseudophaeobacter sp. EL27]